MVFFRLPSEYIYICVWCSVGAVKREKEKKKNQDLNKYENLFDGRYNYS